MASRRARRRYRRRCARKLRAKRRSPRLVCVDPRTLPPRPSSVCRYCWRGPFAAHLTLLPDPSAPISDDTTVQYSYSRPWYALQYCANAGCSWCQRLVEYVRPPHCGSLRIPWKCKLQIRIESAHDGDYTPNGARYFKYRCIRPRTGSPYAAVMMGFHVVLAMEGDPASAFIPTRPLVVNVGSPHTLALAQGCLHDCMSSHERCRGLALEPHSTPLPTRLIDCTDPRRPRLIHTAGGFGEYVALSYVWGPGIQPQRTTIDNLSTYLDHIELAQLPQTIRDAIHVAYSLGFRLLWVDSLCIIQDSREDKHREMAHMRRIYRNASLTIIAASAPDVAEGFLQERPAPKVVYTLPFPCSTSFEPQHAPGQLATRPARVGTIHFTHTGDYMYVKDPIHGRAWCLQEILMSPRSLIFTSRTLQFRCQTTTFNLGGAFHRTSWDDLRLPDILFDLKPIRLPHGSERWRDVWMAWGRVLQEYTLRAVTFPSDKLVALAGLAEDFHRILDTDYLAGLWRSNILLDLLWKRDTFSFRSSQSRSFCRPPAYRAPSWSWASSEVPICFHRQPEYAEYQAMAEVINCETQLADETLPFGEVIGGSLVLLAPLIRCMAVGDTHQNTREFIELRIAVRSQPHSGGDTDAGQHDHDPSYSGWSTFFGHLDADGEDLCCANGSKPELWLALMVLRKHVPRNSDFVECLLLVPALPDEGLQGSGPDGRGSRRTFRRIGHCVVWEPTFEAVGCRGQLDSPDLTEFEII
ncbi:heterokaryon incompatibility protein-domain-containing protein [Trametes polyzona]|nr:heterokaryon incompatibility protein-domain-containing protein [Trametes polyzona]